jgi:hypothetical protein
MTKSKYLFKPIESSSNPLRISNSLHNCLRQLSLSHTPSLKLYVAPVTL